MNNHSIVYFFDKKTDNYYSILDFCTKYNLSFLECNTIDIMAYLARNIKPKFIIINSERMTKELINDFSYSNKQCIIYILNSNSIESINSNVYYLDDYKKLETLLLNHIKYYSNISQLSPNDEKICQELIHNELNRLSFRSKLIGVKYLSDIIQEIVTSESVYNGRCSNLYPKIALKYNTNLGSIERAIRFSIQKAYLSSQNKNLFYEISKCNKAPTVKELTNYMLDKIVLQLNKSKSI